MFHKLQNYDSHLIFQELGIYNFKINVILRTREKYMSFSIEQPKEVIIDCRLSLVFIDSIHFLNGTLDNTFKF